MRLTPWRKQTDLSRETSGRSSLLGLRDQMDRLFDSFFGGSPWSDTGVLSASGSWVPDLEFSETEREFTVRAEVPGLNAEDIDVRVTGNVLTLSGEKKEEFEEKKKGTFRSERRYGTFLRSIELPPGAKPDSIAAEYDKGILTLRIAKGEGAGSHRIPVKPSAPNKEGK
jgi:HSP20 family protein